MLKTPIAGSVKTRLAEDLGAESACVAYRLMVERVFAEIPAHWPIEVHGTPSDQLDTLSSWLGPRPVYRPQCAGDLGERMIHGSETAFAAGAEAVVLLGGDCPWQTRAFFEASESALRTDSLVIGPARDGGYTLLAAKALHRSLFENMSWSTSGVLPETLSRARLLGLCVALLDVLEDVDDAASWQRAQAALFPNFQRFLQSLHLPNRSTIQR